jgi:hypothetical protein
LENLELAEFLKKIVTITNVRFWADAETFMPIAETITAQNMRLQTFKVALPNKR